MTFWPVRFAWIPVRCHTKDEQGWRLGYNWWRRDGWLWLGHYYVATNFFGEKFRVRYKKAGD